MSAIPAEAGARNSPGAVRPVVVKHHALVRLSHWANVILLAGLIVSGLSIYWASPVFARAPRPGNPRGDIVADLGLWVVRHVPGQSGYANPAGWIYERLGLGLYQLAAALRLHWFFAYLFIANGVLYLVGLVLGRGYRALIPRRSDFREALAMVRYYVGVVPAKLLRRPWPHPPVQSKYNALQRSAYLSMPILGILAVASGWAMHKPVQLPWLERLFVNYDGARIVHFFVMIVFAAFVIPHVVLVIADGWDTFRSMITGWSERVGQRHE